MNEGIRAKEVRVIGPAGENYGVLAIHEALAKAKEDRYPTCMDLVRALRAVALSTEAATDEAQYHRLDYVRFFRLLAFVLCAAIAAVAGIVLASGRTGSAVTLVGNQGSYLLQAFTACFLGAVTLRDGEFHIFGTAIGVLLMTVTFSGLIILGVPGYAQTIANGAILIVALAFAGLARRAAARS